MTDTDVIPTALLISALREKADRPEPKIRVKDQIPVLYFFSGFRRRWSRITERHALQIAEPRGSRAKVEAR